MPGKPTSPDAAPKLYSREWWELRKDVMVDIAAQQSRLRRDHPLDVDKQPELWAAIEARSRAAADLALYGQSEERAAIWDAACRHEAKVRGRP